VIVELVQARSSDGVRLDGVLQRASGPAARSASIQGAILLHGVGGNFYGSALQEHLAQVLLDAGISVLRVNTRGHDGMSTVATDTGGRLIGAAYEIVADCCYDVDAWVRFLLDCGPERIALVGHSLGALKAIYAQAEQPHEAVERVVAISPPRLAYSKFVHGSQAVAFAQSLETAQQKIEAGEPEALFRSTFPFPLFLSAATFCDKYGPQERYDLLKLSARLSTKVDFIFGQTELDEGTSAFAGLVDEIHAAHWPGGYSLEIIPGADHFYRDRFQQLGSAVTRTLSCLKES
jgi:pimeloyl-ACP methyl ester carboxylesterase